MTLRELQSEFAQCAGRLIQQARIMGYEVTLGDAHRSAQECTRLGKTNSCHGKRLAIDLNLFRDGVFLTDSKDHKPLGDYWKRQHEKARWGGDFEAVTDPVTGVTTGGPDGNHYSFEYKGHK